MKVCPNCFADKELKSYISSLKETGDCFVCSSKNQPLLELEELFDFFQELVSCYQTSENGETINVKIQSHWSFFGSHEIAQKILNYVLPKLNSEITSTNVNVDYTQDIIKNFSYWEVLKEDLKWKNRFIVDIEFLKELGWDSYFDTNFYLKPEISLFRARLHHQSGSFAFDYQDMFCPNRTFATAGRANSAGIPYLYLSDNSETVLYEVRASYLDELTLGKFQLKLLNKEVKIVDFTADISLFGSSLLEIENPINSAIKGKLLRKKISLDLSKPMRRYDNEIEYIPTQFICEFIKVFTGASGIKFNSSLHPIGNNYVIFDQEIMECTEVKLVRVNNIELKSIHL